MRDFESARSNALRSKGGRWSCLCHSEFEVAGSVEEKFDSAPILLRYFKLRQMVCPEVEGESSPLDARGLQQRPAMPANHQVVNTHRTHPLSADSTQCCQVQYRPEPIPTRD